MALHIFSSNRLEELTELLFHRVSSRQDPLKSQWISVQNRSMEKWISMKLADAGGIWANCWYPFSNELIQRIFSLYFEEPVLQERYLDSDVIIFEIMSIIEQAVNEKSLSALKNYISDNDSEFEKQKLYQLSSILANLYDQYITYRPDMLNAWDRSSYDDLTSGLWDQWQGYIWKKITESRGTHHPPAVLKKVLSLIKKKGRISSLPHQISLFGISSLPPFHFQVIMALSGVMDVNVYLLNPCREFWFDVLNPSEERFIINKKKNAVDLKDLHLQGGNSLLSSWGTYGRDFLSMLYDVPHEDHSVFFENNSPTLLNAIQNNILMFNEEPVDFNESADAPRISFHSCHSELRELEVLKDYILYCMDHHDLGPSEVLVMAPDIEKYGPLIETVFQQGDYPLPCNISDAKNYMKSPDIKGFFQLLQFISGRFAQSEFFSLLDVPAIDKQFAFSGNADLVKQWIRDCNIFWSKDAEQKNDYGLPAFAENTWSWGFDKMLMGYALSDENLIEQQIVPHSVFEGESALLLGRVLDFHTLLVSYSQSVKGMKNCAQWSMIFADIIADFFGDTRAFDFIKEKLASLEESFDVAVSADIAIQWLLSIVEKKTSVSGIFNGAVNFCELLPMRSIPFRMIAMVGMNHDAFPRHSSSPDFDLIASEPKKGDRSLNLEDRYIFLEALVSARDFFYISYTGQDASDNTELPPSIVVSELIDYCEKICPASEGLLLKKERLHGYDSAYFSGKGPVSYNTMHYNSFMSLLKQSDEHILFCEKPYNIELSSRITPQDFVAFVTHPHRFILQRYFNISPYVEDDAGEDAEPFHISGLEKYHIQNSLLHDLMESNLNLEQAYSFLKGRGIVPHGSIGPVAFNNLVKEIDGLKKSVLEHIEPPVVLSDIDCSIDGIGISGPGIIVSQQTCYYIRAAKMKVADELALWVYLLLHGIAGNAKKGVLISKDKVLTMQCPAEPLKALQPLVDMYLHSASSLPGFVPDISYVYADKLNKKKDSYASLREAEKKWYNQDFITGKSIAEDPFLYLAYRGSFDSLENFSQISQKILIPFFLQKAES